MHSTRAAPLAALSAALALLSGCYGHDSSPAAVRPEPGGPIPGLSPAERSAFERGKLVFERRFTPEDGLGPRYNSTSCVSCHSTPVTGGSAPLYRNFYLAMSGVPGRQTPVPGLPSAVVPSYGNGGDFTTEAGRHTLAPLAGTNHTLAQRNSVPLFGVGLFEFVSDATILANADPNDEDGDGISGRFNTDAGTIGRFGVKAQSNNVELFTRAPLMNQMGITSDPFLGSGGSVGLGHSLPQVSTDPNSPTRDFDAQPDPEISRRDLGDLIAFTRFLAPIAPLPFGPGALRGEDLFTTIGCAKCHIPELPSARGAVRAYTDLLLHDLGSALADGLGFGVPQVASLAPSTTAGEFRTQPLWGVSLSGPFLHDGRAETLREALEMHAGEAQASRARFEALAPNEQADLITFLECL